MPGVSPGQPIAPGVAGPGDGYPQWGVAGNVGDSASWKIAEAHSDAEKLGLAGRGYLTWFSSKKAAQDFISSEKAPVLNGKTDIPNPLSGVAAIGDFFSRLTNPHTWLRVAEGLVGVAFLVIGLNALLHNPAGKAAALAAKVRP